MLPKSNPNILHRSHLNIPKSLNFKPNFFRQQANNGTMLRQAHAAATCGGGYAQRRDNYGRTDLLFLCIFPILFRGGIQ